ncbi:TetR/AcrR family transcriptional regulator [Caenibius tardaugens]|nr:TetR/AcrR family transcriptional regulator [Caenibius tardaugens]
MSAQTETRKSGKTVRGRSVAADKRDGSGGEAIGGRERVLQAAVRILEVSGIRGLSLRAAAEAAGVTLPTVQHHFASLGDLLNQACEQILLRAAASLEMPDEDGVQSAVRRHDDHVAARLGAALGHRLGVFYGQTVGELTAAAHLARHGSGRAAARGWVASRLLAVRRLAGAHYDRRFLAEVSLGLELLSLGCAKMPNIALVNQEVMEKAVAYKRGLVADDLAEVPFWFGRENAELAPILAQEKPPAPSRPGRPSNMPKPLYAAAVALFAEGGLTAMTYRALAAKAKTSVSVVSYHIPTSAQIFYGAYRLIHSRQAWPGRTLANEEEPTLSVALADIAGVRAHLLSFQALSAGATEPEFQFHAWSIRMMRGGHFWRNPPASLHLHPDDFRRHLFSIWLLGAGFLAEASRDPERAAAFLRLRVPTIRERLGVAAVAEFHIAA